MISEGEAAALHLEQDNEIANTTFTPQKQSLEPVQDSISAPAIRQSQELSQASTTSHAEVIVKEPANATVLVSERRCCHF